MGLRDILAKLMDSRNLRYRDLARLLGIPPSTAFAWTQGSPLTLTQRNLTALRRLSREVGMSVGEILSVETERTVEAERELIRALRVFVTAIGEEERDGKR